MPDRPKTPPPEPSKPAGSGGGGGRLGGCLDPPFGLSLGGWNACRTLQDNIMLNNTLSQLSRG